MSAPLTPTPPEQRYDVLDILRGIALFGILPVNLIAISQPTTWLWGGLDPFDHPLDDTAHWWIRLLFEQKFYPLFSLLFGVGIALQFERAQRRGQPFTAAFLRRMAALALFGLLQIVLVWYGDILLMYALFSLPLVLVVRTRRAALGAIAVGAALVGLCFHALLFLGAADGGGNAAQVSDWLAESTSSALSAHAGTSFTASLNQRISDYVWMMLSWPSLAPKLFAIFCAGLLLVRGRWFQDVPTHRRGWSILALVALPLGLLGNWRLANLHDGQGDPLAEAPVEFFLLDYVAPPLLMLGYVAVATLALQRGAVRRLLGWTAAVGRTALSNYLAQNVIAAILVHGWGFGWYGQLPPRWVLPLAVTIYLVLAMLSHVWLRCKRYGPMEWLWRALTYGRAPADRPAGS